MGDDLSQPERESIRTPMQWSADANGGFSKAPADKLVRPVISTGEYRYERVNVLSQRLDEHSLLNWTERAVRMRKECPEIGWGEMRLLKTSNPAVLAHTCAWRGQTVAAIHNFSRAACAVNVEWPEGTQELQFLFGRDVREVGPQPAGVVDLDGYDYRWIRLRGMS